MPLLGAVAYDGRETSSHRAKAFLYLGLCQVALGDSEGAAGYLREAFQLDAEVALPASVPPGGRALARQVRAQLGLSTPMSPEPVVAQPPPPPVGSASDLNASAGVTDEQARLGAARAALDRMAAQLQALREQGAPQARVDEAAAMMRTLQEQIDALQAASVQAAPAAPPAAPPPKQMGPYVLGADLIDVGFIGTRQFSPTPEIELGLGDDVTRMSLVLGAMLGQQPGYSEKLRWAFLGTSANPVGWNWTVEAGFVEVSGPQGTTYLELSSCPVNVTWKVAKRLLLEARVIGFGYYLSLDGNGLSTWSLEGGLAMRWLP
ncbi:MAG TPA: hypothetical protein VMB50_22330 [Myxococcales bacterium]|nr:hypothetical protein [Myxococcales bacterium]